MTMLANWEGIPPPGDTSMLNVLRADPRHPLDFRIGRDARGRFAFQLEAQGMPLGTSAIESPAGMDLVLERIGDNQGRLTLLLHDREDFDIFRVLCGDLLDATRAIAHGDSLSAVNMLLGRLDQWQKVLARRRQGRLTQNEEMGLVGELMFLRDVLLKRNGIAPAITAWRGPYGDEQDFAVASAIIEVKTQGTTSDSWISVSSEDQLDISSGSIFLCHQCIAASTSVEHSETLDGLIGELLTASASLPVSNSLLRTGLDAAGWTEGAGYDKGWRLEDRSFYRVEDGFPSIVRTDLRAGIARVRYQIAVAACHPFRVEETALFTRG
jgi:hypothetical protein